MSACNRLITKFASTALVLIPALALAVPAQVANARGFVSNPQPVRPVLSNSQEPGSVIVFPLSIPGTTTVDGLTTDITQFEVGTVCPQAIISGGGHCPQGQGVKIHFHWVCPQAYESSSQVCREEDFDLFSSVGGKIIFGPNGAAYAGDNRVAPVPPCANPTYNAQGIGYLIGWVVNSSDQPISFDGLIGNAVIRTPPLSGFSTTAGPTFAPAPTGAVGTYSGITIQADPALAVGALVNVSSPATGSALQFDGQKGDYTAVTGQLSGDVEYDNFSSSTGKRRPQPFAGVETFLSLLTLDVNSGYPNEPTEVNMEFFNADTESGISTGVLFICYGLEELTLDINPNLTAAFMSPRGEFITGQAMQSGKPATLLGVVFTLEDATTPAVRDVIFGTTNNSVPIPTTYVTNDQGNPQVKH